MSNQTVDPFMQGNAEAIKFETVGQVETLIVRSVDKKVDTDMDNVPKTWPNGDPKHVFVFTGEYEGSEAPRSFWVRGNMVTAVRDAVKKAGLATVVDTKLTLTFYDEGTPPKAGLKPPKLFKAEVEKVAAAVASNGGGFDDEEPFVSFGDDRGIGYRNQVAP